MDVDFGIRHCPQCGVAYGPYWEDDEGLCPACERLEQLREAAKIKRKPKMKPPAIIECAICKKKFEKRGTTDKYCDDCKHSALRKKQREYEKRKREQEAKNKKVVLLEPVHLEEGSDPRDAWMPERQAPQKKNTDSEAQMQRRKAAEADARADEGRPDRRGNSIHRRI